ncbi:MAG TPA: secretin N-terminal domain-containing protein [Longimicrobiales bacterium]|nr:secretin N-terminal domain-containing protein [Longimicrobiales bacterium]
MMPIIALLLALFAPAVSAPRTVAELRAPDSQITALTVAPAAGRTEVVIRVDGAITANDFMMDDGRLVIDLSGASHGSGIDRAVNRGGLQRLRVAQFRPGVVRVVLVLGRAVPYEITREEGSLRVSFANPAGDFEPWSTAMSGAPAQPHPMANDAAPRSALTEPAPPPNYTSLAPVRQQRQSQEPPIDVNFEEEPVANVAAAFAEFADTTILVAPEARAKNITASIRGMPWDVALRSILDAHALTIRSLQSGVLLVEDATTVAGRRVTDPPVTQQFPVQFVSADSIRMALQSVLGEEGRVSVSQSANSLIVTGPPDAVSRIREVLPQLDVRAPQVDIEAKIAFIDRTTLEGLGIVYDLKDLEGNQFNRVTPGGLDLDGDGNIDEILTDDAILLGGNSIAALGNANARIQSPALEVAMSLALGRFSLVTFLEALRQVSLTDIQAKPMIRTMDHRRALIQVGEQTPIRVIDAGGAGVPGGEAPRATVQYKNTGVILEVTPHITGNQVVLDMRAERSNIGAAPADLGITFQTQLAQTQVIVEDGETIVIGGLTITEKTEVRSGIPILMDLPVLGALFRNTTERENKRDLLIMVTPHIVRQN